MSHRSKVVLFHATPVANLASILKRGLLPRLAQGKRQAVWLCSGGRRAWAVAHVADRHDVDPGDVVVLRVVVSRCDLRCYRRGRWYTPEIIQPSQIHTTAWVS